MDFVDEDFEVEILGGLGIRELRSMAERAVAGLAPEFPVRLQRIVAVVAGRSGDRGLRQGDFSTRGDEGVKRVDDVLAALARQLAADRQSFLAIVVFRQGGLERIGKEAGLQAGESSVAVVIRLESVGERGLAPLSLMDVFPARDLREDVALVRRRSGAVGLCRGDGEAQLAKLGAVERRALVVADAEGDDRVSLLR